MKDVTEPTIPRLSWWKRPHRYSGRWELKYLIRIRITNVNSDSFDLSFDAIALKKLFFFNVGKSARLISSYFQWRSNEKERNGAPSFADSSRWHCCEGRAQHHDTSNLIPKLSWKPVQITQSRLHRMMKEPTDIVDKRCLGMSLNNFVPHPSAFFFLPLHLSWRLVLKSLKSDSVSRRPNTWCPALTCVHRIYPGWLNRLRPGQRDA